MKNETLYQGYFTLVRTERSREVVLAGDAVAVLVACPKLRTVYLQGQDRDALIGPQNPSGYTVEVCAGRLDKKSESVKAAAAREVAEELGITTDEGVVRLIHGEPLTTSTGMTNERIWLAYVEVEPEQIAAGIHWGVAEEDESTTRVEIPYDAVAGYPVTDLKTFALIQWFTSFRLLADPGQKCAGENGI
jgi:8-oxo-dGTP pyrophosphatase MutT (NUDIX family)